MDPQALLAPPAPQGAPAPIWFMQFFKVVGFFLHILVMHFWYAGAPLAAALLYRNSDHAKRLAGQIGRILPFAVALGVNFGIVPLLFVQATHYRVYYPAGILMAWPWFAVFPLLTVAYYGVYYFAVQVKQDRVDALGRAVLTVAAALFVIIGFLFANNFSLMVNVEGWPAIAERTGVSGAVTGLALNLGDATLLPRWLMMLGLAVMTTAVWIAADTAFLATAESDDYRAYARKLALHVYVIGTGVFALMGAWYVFGTLGDGKPDTFGSILLFGLTALAPGLALAALAAHKKSGDGQTAWRCVGAQAVVLALNAASRQITQTRELAPYDIVGSDPVTTQWSTLPLFLVCFVAAIAIIAWMLRRVWIETRPAEAEAAETEG